MHDLLPHVHLAEVLEEAQQRDVQALPAVLGGALRVHPRVHRLQQPEHARRQVPVYRLLRRSVPGAACLGFGVARRATP